ncbi:MAG: hypothetical protein KC438_07940, partial [Thermomicrobiales bacterium]|nr:hypothetical protein [Thermomicrobiales bacterium]
MAGIRVKAGFESMRRHGVCLPVALAVFIILSILSVSTGMEVSAHAEIERTTPAQDSILAAPPENLQFW